KVSLLMADGGLPSTKKTVRIEANAKHRKRARIISAVRAANMTGRTMDVRIIACCVNLMNERSGLKAHRTLAPASARYAKRQMMWGGKVSLDQFRMTKRRRSQRAQARKIYSPRGAPRPSRGAGRGR